MEYYGDDFEALTAEQRSALDQVHGKMTQDIAEAHSSGDKSRAEQLVGYRRMVSDELADGGFREAPAYGNGRDEREALEEHRADLTRELHEAVASKDSGRAGKLDRERNELTEMLYGNGAAVGDGGRSL